MRDHQRCLSCHHMDSMQGFTISLIPETIPLHIYLPYFRVMSNTSTSIDPFQTKPNFHSRAPFGQPQSKTTSPDTSETCDLCHHSVSVRSQRQHVSSTNRRSHTRPQYQSFPILPRQYLKARRLCSQLRIQRFRQWEPSDSKQHKRMPIERASQGKVSHGRHR